MRDLKGGAVHRWGYILITALGNKLFPLSRPLRLRPSPFASANPLQQDTPYSITMSCREDCKEPLPMKSSAPLLTVTTRAHPPGYCEFVLLLRSESH